MKQLFSTKQLRKLKCIIPVVLFFMLLAVDVYPYKGPYLYLPDAENDYYQPSQAFLPSVVIMERGTVAFRGRYVEELTKLPALVEDALEELQAKGDKVLLKVDRYAKFGRVQEVLRVLQKADIRVVGLITERYAALVDFFGKPVKER
ncbi:MAG: hypothetical protein GY757_34005 [bacterium]|nr:hypothetical protein [bacterium]